MPVRTARKRNNMASVLAELDMEISKLAELTGASTEHLTKVAAGTAAPSRRLTHSVAMAVRRPVDEVFPPPGRPLVTREAAAP